MQIPALDLHFCREVGFMQDAMACEHRRGGQRLILCQVRLQMVPEASFTSLQVLTRLSETVTGSSEISLRRDRRAIVGPNSWSGKLPEGMEAT